MIQNGAESTLLRRATAHDSLSNGCLGLQGEEFYEKFKVKAREFAHSSSGMTDPFTFRKPIDRRQCMSAGRPVYKSAPERPERWAARRSCWHSGQCAGSTCAAHHYRRTTHEKHLTYWLLATHCAMDFLLGAGLESRDHPASPPFLTASPWP